MNAETSSQCHVCTQLMNGADDLKRCRINGLEATAANADGCRKFVDVALDYMLADTVRPWCGK